MKARITKEQIMLMNKRISREMEIEEFGGSFKSYNRVHKSKKAYNRKNRWEEMI